MLRLRVRVPDLFEAISHIFDFFDLFLFGLRCGRKSLTGFMILIRWRWVHCGRQENKWLGTLVNAGLHSLKLQVLLSEI